MSLAPNHPSAGPTAAGRRHRGYQQLWITSLALLLSFTLPVPWNRLSAVGYLLLGAVMLWTLGPISSPPGSRQMTSRLYAGLGLAALTAGAFWYVTPHELRASGIPLVGLWSLFTIFSAKRLMQGLAQERTINAEVLQGALAGYLMLGLSGGLLCSALETVDPGSFSNVVLRGADVMDGMPVWGLNFIRLNYYAFVTLTTTGYGDVVPISPAAQILSVLISVAGTFYLAIVMGLLISRLSQAESGRPHDGP
jgi:hypothetical protein